MSDKCLAYERRGAVAIVTIDSVRHRLEACHPRGCGWSCQRQSRVHGNRRPWQDSL